MPPVFLDAHGLAEQLDVRYQTILSWARRGKIPHIRDGRGRYLFNLNSVSESLRPKSRELVVDVAGQGGER
jgi:excisionase family DNA binding protein